MKYAITNAQVFTGERVLESKTIIIEDGIISSIQIDLPEDAEIIDLKGQNIAPGFFDIQINGGRNLYFYQTPDEETLHDIADASLQFGTTQTLPCLITSKKDSILQAIETVRHFMQNHDKGVMGLHLEGPFLNPLKSGIHSKEIIRKPTNQELEEIVKYGKDVIKLMTIAPEFFTDDQLQMLIDNGITLSAGHSEMNYDQAQKSFSKGVKLVTHLYNAMTQMGHREPGIVGAVFDNDQVYAPIILDGGHCSYAAARIAYRQKKNHLFLITDSSFLGREKRSFQWGDFDIRMNEDGFYRNEHGQLAGAAISMPEAAQNALEHLGISLQEAVEMCTSRVAKAVRLDHQCGYIKPGYPARFIKFGNDFTKFESLTFNSK